MTNELKEAFEALERLKKGNESYLKAERSGGDISPRRRLFTSQNGQSPYAVIVSCADSRVIPESIFSAGIGELFVIRAAGNVLDQFALGSVEYAVEHLHAKLVVVMGHTGCGAVGAAHEKNSGYLGRITDEIKAAIGQERDGEKASILNAKHSAEKIKSILPHAKDVLVLSALYHTDSGAVDFFEA